jgi:hypothetical protein
MGGTNHQKRWTGSGMADVVAFALGPATETAESREPFELTCEAGEVWGRRSGDWWRW